MMVEVFKTDVTDEQQAREVKELLQLHFPGTRVNFDLDDCDKVLRVEGTGFTTEHILVLVQRKGVICNTLD
jgi:hypothetical protein